MLEVEKLKRAFTEADEKAVDNSIAALMEHRDTRKFLWWLLTVGRVGTQPYAGNALNTAFSCGELNVGQQILDRIIQVAPEGYVTMMKESANERSERDAALGRASDADRNRTYGRSEAEFGESAGGDETE